MSDASSLPPTAPLSLRFSATVVILQSLVACATGIWLIAQDLRTRGVDSASLESTSAVADWIGTGTAVFIFLIFGTALVAAVALLRGRQWGRGPIVPLEFLLIFVAIYMFLGGAILPGVAVLLSVAFALWGIFDRASVEWFDSSYQRQRRA
ncbi:MAG TPA: hypothetical protein VFC72_06525 [Corynebacterium sp.]|nr:hypothetical protein [Corynebacterium sp.]